MPITEQQFYPIAMPSPLPRPELSVHFILGYAFFAFLLGLILTPWFISFLRRNRLGKQLRVETVDGREASIFRKYHEKKFGTPTMGGLLIWGSIVLTIIFSRVLALFGVVHNSLLQRTEVYLPLLTMIALGILGAVDDYLNIVSSDEKKIREFVPTMKAFFILSIVAVIVGLVFIFSTPLRVWADLSHALTSAGAAGLLIVVVLLLVYLAVGKKIDEWFMRFLVKQGAKKGLAVLPKITSLLLVALLGAFWFYFKLERDAVYVPFYGLFSFSALHIGTIGLGWLYIPFFMFIIVGTANAVNVTDGLDGLAGGLLIIAFGAFGVLAYLHGLYVLAGFCAITTGALAAFLWHNVPPALFYMGDTGALALGGTLGLIAMMTDQALILPLVGFVFVIEMLSVIIQLTSKKFRGGKKVFKAAPIHHHFEALEWGESKVTMRLWIIGAFFAFIGLVFAVTG